MTLSTATHFERTPVRGTTLDDLDLESLRAFLEGRAPRLLEQLTLAPTIDRLGLSVTTGSTQLPTVAGTLLFGLQPQLLHPEWGLAAVRVQGQTLADPIVAREDLEGTIPEMIDAGMAFVGRYTQELPNQVELEETATEYPRGAVREGLLNALIHRDWAMSGRAALRIFDDRLELWSPGGPSQAIGLFLEDLSGEGGVSLPRNPIIAATCRALRLGEQLGRGLLTMRRAVAESTGEALAIAESKRHVCVTIPSALHASRRPS